MSQAHTIYLEIGRKRIAAVSVQWPGWCRIARNEEAAIDALLVAGPRYASIAHAAGLAFTPPQHRDQLTIVARPPGTSTTDFGSIDAELADDWKPISVDELARAEQVLHACWAAFDAAVVQAQGYELRKGPRGGGRDLARMVEHVVSAEKAYLSRLGWRSRAVKDETLEQRIGRLRQAAIDGMHAYADGTQTRTGPRGGRRWSVRFFVRRVAWHALDHAWEIEDRIIL